MKRPLNKFNIFALSNFSPVLNSVKKVKIQIRAIRAIRARCLSTVHTVSPPSIYHTSLTTLKIGSSAYGARCLARVVSHALTAARNNTCSLKYVSFYPTSPEQHSLQLYMFIVMTVV